MAFQSDVKDDPNYHLILDHGFVGLVDSMGTDSSIVQAARVSYGSGTKTVNEDRGLIRYLMRARHTSPFEMCEVKLHIKIPIVVMRQLVRHRTASLNEYSGRYSVMTDEMYMPNEEYILPQSSNNKQGRGGEISDADKLGVRWIMDAAHKHAYTSYQQLLHKAGELPKEAHEQYDPYSEDDPILSNEYPGLARELARNVLPLSTYTELYWKQDLHNILHLLKLRYDSHAQQEIQDTAKAIYKIVEELFPITVEAWEDYVRNARSLSRMEVDMLYDLIGKEFLKTKFDAALDKVGGSTKDFGQIYGLSKREVEDFKTKWLDF